VGFMVRGTPIVYDVGDKQLSCKGKSAPLSPSDGKIRLRLLVDRTSLEIFGNDGRVYMPMGVIHPEKNRSLAIFSTGGTVKVTTLDVYELNSAWE